MLEHIITFTENMFPVCPVDIQATDLPSNGLHIRKSRSSDPDARRLQDELGGL